MGCAKSKEAQSQQGKRPFSFRSFHRRTIFRRSFHRGNKGDDTEQAHSQSHRLSNSENVVPSESFKKNDNNRADGGDRVSKEYNQGKSHSNETRQTYSDETNQKVSSEDPITPTMTPYGKVEDPRTPTTMSEAEVINGRESTKGVKDDIPISPTNFAENNHNFSFQVVTDSSPSNEPIVIDRDMEPKPTWLQTAANDSVPSTKTIVSDFDPEIISTFRKALEELSPNCAAILRSPESEAFPSPGHSRLISNDSKDGTPSLGKSRIPSKNDNNSTVTSRGQNKVVLYFTSLRGVRKTYEDCCNVRAILKSMGVNVDERDVSMHYGFRDELRQLLGTEGLLCKLPRVFVNGKYVGGAEEIQRMDDTGELGNVIKGCEMVDESDGNVCEMCGDVKFVPCEVCSGSCKIYVEDDGHEGQHGGIDDGDGDGGFRRCPYCNENGIVRCPRCCSE